MSITSITAAICIFLSATSIWAGTLRDSFDDGDFAGWQMLECLWGQKNVTPNVGNWVVENGAVVGGDNNQAKRYDLYIGDRSWTDYTAEVSVKFSKKLETCTDPSGVYLCARYQVDEGKLGLNTYFVGAWKVGVARRGGQKHSNGNFLNIQTIMLPTEVGTWYRLKIEVAGDQITGFADDVKVFALRDGSFTSGVVNIGVNGLRATFDDFMVTGPDIPDGVPGHSVESSGKLATTWAEMKKQSRVIHSPN